MTADVSTSERSRGNAVVLATEEPKEQELLAGLLAFAQGAASASALLQHFPSIGHVISADPLQLRASGLTGSDVTLLRLVRESPATWPARKCAAAPCSATGGLLIDYLQTAMAHEQIEQFRVFVS